jgi:hypothetical protein
MKSAASTATASKPPPAKPGAAPKPAKPRPPADGAAP